MTSLERAVPTVVLDTNVVLDWLVFHNPDCAQPVAAIVAGNLRWLATQAMRDELAHVLATGRLDAWAPAFGKVWAHWDRYCDIQPPPTPTGPPGRLRCGDPDDQKFIDLAVAGSVRWLLSRDRAVLKLAPRLRERGVEALTPARWAMPKHA